MFRSHSEFRGQEAAQVGCESWNKGQDNHFPHKQWPLAQVEVLWVFWGFRENSGTKVNIELTISFSFLAFWHLGP